MSQERLASVTSGIEKANQKIQALAAEERAKEVQRTELREELIAEGINPDDIENELARLERENDELLTKTEGELTKINDQLEKLES